MSTTEVTVHVAAPVDDVFDCVAHIDNFSQVVDDIVDVEFLSEHKRGLGARFKETRKMGKKSATTTLKVTEYVENDRVRLVSDEGGTIWDTLFSVADDDGHTQLTVVMMARPYKTLARLMTPMIRGMIQKAITDDMHAVKAFCEARATSAGGDA